MPPSPSSATLAAKASASADLALIRRIAEQERSALEALYYAYHRRLSRFLGRMTRRQDLVDEAINDTFYIVWQKAAEFRGESQVSTWLMGIAYRCTLKTLRQGGSGPMESMPLEEDEQQGSSEVAAAHELLDWVSKGLAYLPEEQRMTMELAYCLGHSLEEIAAIMDCPVSTVKARMFHARMKLRNLLPALATPTQGARDGYAI